MSSTIRTTLAICCLSLAAARAADQPAVPRPTQPDGKPSEKKVVAAPRPPAGSAGSVVFVDPVTGQFVEPSAEDVRKLLAPQGRVAPKAPLTLINLPGGAIEIVMPPSSFSQAVASIDADGKLSVDCVTGDTAAKSPTAKEPPKAKDPRDEKR